MYQIAVCDDERDTLAKICALMEETMAGLKIPFCIDSFDKVDRLIAAVAEKTYHLLLLDILFDGPSGMELAVLLRSQGLESSIIFISSSADYLLAGYDVHAISYLLKPPDKSKLQDAVAYALRYGPRPTAKINIICNGQPCTIEQQDVVYLESRLHAVLIHTQHRGELRWWGKLDDLAAALHDIYIAKCHKSIWVNLSHIKQVRSVQVELRNGVCLPISRSRAVDFKARYAKYMTH